MKGESLLNNLNILTVFLAGLASFLSPCVLPIATGYIAYIAGAIFEDELKNKKLLVLRRTLGFVLGFTVVFVLLGITASSIGTVLNGYRNILLKIGGVFLILLGFSLIGILNIKITGIQKKMPLEVSSITGSFFVGMFFGIGWTPCVGAILGAVLIYAGSQETILKGGILLTIYSLGLSIPFILTSIFINKIDRFWKKLLKFEKVIRLIMGIIIIIMGVLMFLNKLSIIK